LAFETPAYIARKTSKSIEYRGAIGMVVGIFTFIIFYAIQINLVWKFTHIKWITIVYGITLPLSGIFAYWYYQVMNNFRAKWMTLILFYKKSIPLSYLVIEREQIIAEFDTARSEYNNLNTQ
jgi:hypothetical protein